MKTPPSTHASLGTATAPKHSEHFQGRPESKRQRSKKFCDKDFGLPVAVTSVAEKKLGRLQTCLSPGCTFPTK